jgi:hypothetical protein
MAARVFKLEKIKMNFASDYKALMDLRYILVFTYCLTIFM